MKILLINLWRIIEGKGGTEKVFFDMAKAMADKGHEVAALALENKRGEPFFCVPNNVSFINVGLGFKPQFTLWQSIWNKICLNKNSRHCYRDNIIDMQKASRIAPVITEEKPDIIISFNAEATRVLKLNMQVECPIITMFHFNPSHILESCTTNTKKALSMSDCIQVLMPSFIEETKKYIVHNNITCITNSVPQYIIDKTIDESRENVIINVARIDRHQKRQHILIEAFALLANDFPDWKVEFWGAEDGDLKYYEYCLGLVRTYKLEGRVLFCGTTSNIVTQLKRAKIFAFPSAFEGFSLSLTEAMSAGLPCVGCKDGISVNEIIEEGKTGFLCNANAGSFAGALKELMVNENLRHKMGKSAKKSVERYSPECIWKKWDNLIEETVAKYNDNKSRE